MLRFLMFGKLLVLVIRDSKSECLLASLFARYARLQNVHRSLVYL